MSFRPLRIVLNATAAISGGSVTYWLNMLPALAALETPHEFHVLVSRAQNRLDEAIPASFRVTRVGFPAPRAVTRMLWDQAGLPILLLRSRADVLLAAADMGPLISPCPVVLAIRNANPWWGPPGSSRGERVRERVLRTMTTWAAHRASRVYFVSEDSRRRMVPALGIPPSKTSVAHHGIGERFFPPAGASGGPSGPSGGEPAPGADGYVLCVSAVRGHKDLETLLRAFAETERETPRGLRLVIAGALVDAPYRARLLRLAVELGIEKRVELRGEVPYSDLPDLYRRASVFVLPTLAETFGHPLVEAMASGVAVIATDLDITREVCADAAAFYPAGDWRRLSVLLNEVLADDRLRQARITAGRSRAREFSWSRTARRTLDLLEEAAGAARDQTVAGKRAPTKDSSTV